ELVKPDGSTVTSNEVIAVIDSEARATNEVTNTAAAVAPVAAKPSSPPASATVTALPAARKMMADQSVEPAAVEGTGRRGRITKGDVITAVEARSGGGKGANVPAASVSPSAPSVSPSVSPPPSGPSVSISVSTPAVQGSRPEQRVPMSRLRQRVAERLVQSQATAAILTTFNEVNM